MQRRQFVRGAAVACIAGVAGCGGDGAEDETPQSTPESGDEGTAPPDDGDATPESTQAEPDDADGGNNAVFADAVDFESGYVMEMEFENPETGEVGQATIRVNGGDSHMSMTGDGESFELYTVDGDTYSVSGDQCTVFSGGDANVDFDVDADASDFQQDAQAHPDVEAAGTDTLDGEQVLVYEIDETENEGIQEATYYVSASSGYLRRVETDQGWMELHSWGDVDPISAPDMDCQSMGDFDQ